MSSQRQQRSERVVRVLNLLAYVDKHPASTVMEIARDLGLDPIQVRDDLDMLHLSGVGKGPAEMIDLEHDWMGVRIIDAQGLDKPLRLTPTEANALLLLLESLETMPGLIDQSAVASAAAKIRAVTLGGSVADATPDAAAGPAEVVAQALAQHRQLEITYYSAGSDSTTTRAVEPIDVIHADGQTYLRALDGGEAKHFRFDRIRAASLLDAYFTPPSSKTHPVNPRDPFGLGKASVARLRVHRDATWMADYWAIELDPADLASLEDPEVEWVAATLPYGGSDWLVRFCLANADRVRLTHPPELAAEVRGRASRALEALL